MGQGRVSSGAGGPAAPTAQLAAWEFAGLMVTYWCNARCAFCYLHGGPDRGGMMDVGTALALWRSLDRLAAAHGRTMRIHLTGGEPFHDWVRLVSIIRAARDAGLTPPEKVETNAFWATADGLTRARLELLDALRMQKLVVSTDVFHQQYVPFERVQRCVEMARRVLRHGRVRVRWWDFYRQPVDVRRLSAAEEEQAFRAALGRHKDRLTGRAAAELARLLPRQPAVAFQGQNCLREVLHSKHVHIDPQGHIFPGTCAGIILGRATEPTAPGLPRGCWSRDGGTEGRRDEGTEGNVAAGVPAGRAEGVAAGPRTGRPIRARSPSDGPANPVETAADKPPAPAGRRVHEVWQDLAENWRHHPVVAAVVAGGSYQLLQRVKVLGYRELSSGYANKCHLCAHIRQFLVDGGLWPEFIGPPECYAYPTER